MPTEAERSQWATTATVDANLGHELTVTTFQIKSYSVVHRLSCFPKCKPWLCSLAIADAPLGYHDECSTAVPWCIVLQRKPRELIFSANFLLIH